MTSYIILNSYDLCEHIRMAGGGTYDRARKGWVVTEDTFGRLKACAVSNKWGTARAWVKCRVYVYEDAKIGECVKDDER